MSDERRLTKPQRTELAELAKKPQQTFGKARAAVQNRLVGMGLAVFTRQGLSDLCEITATGRVAVVTGLAPLQKHHDAEKREGVPKVAAVRGDNRVNDVPEDTRDARILELEAENRKLVSDGARIIASWENHTRDLELLLNAAYGFSFGEGDAMVVVDSADSDGAGPIRWSVTGTNLIPTHFDSRDAAIEEAKRRVGDQAVSRLDDPRARIADLEADVRRLEHIHHYYRCPCGARVPENAPCPYCGVRNLTFALAAAKRRWEALRSSLRYGLISTTTSSILDGVLDEMRQLESEP